MDYALAIPHEIWVNENLNFTEKLIIGRIVGTSSHNTYVWYRASEDTQYYRPASLISNEELAKDLDLTPHTISRYIASIEKKGLIKREIVNKNGKTTRHVYIV